MKQYSTFVQIDNPPDDVRTGLTAKVEIDVETIPNAITLPIEAVVEHNGFYYCLVKNGDNIEARWLPLGASNASRVVIRDNKVQANELVIQNPDNYLNLIAAFPDPPVDYMKQQQELIAAKRKNNDATAAAANISGNAKERRCRSRRQRWFESWRRLRHRRFALPEIFAAAAVASVFTLGGN